MPFLALVVHSISNNLHNSSSGGIFSKLARFVLRFFQFVLGLTVIGLYGQDLSNASKHHAYTDSKWVYAVVVAGISCVTVLIYALPNKWKFVSWYFFAWDLVLVILWLALFGIFGKLYFHEDPEGDSGVQRMKNAVWVDLVNAILWLITFLFSGAIFWHERRTRTLHTGRAEV